MHEGNPTGGIKQYGHAGHKPGVRVQQYQAVQIIQSHHMSRYTLLTLCHMQDVVGGPPGCLP